MENRTPSGKVMNNIREDLDGVLLEGLEALHLKSGNAALEEDQL